MSAFWLEQVTGDFLAGDSSCVFVVLVEMRKGGFGVLFQLNSFTCAVQFFFGEGGPCRTVAKWHSIVQTWLAQ